MYATYPRIQANKSNHPLLTFMWTCFPRASCHRKGIPVCLKQKSRTPTHLSSCSLPLYHQPNVLNKEQKIEAPYRQKWPLTTYIHGLLEGKDEDEKMSNLTDSFSNFDSVLENDAYTAEERNKVTKIYSSKGLLLALIFVFEQRYLSTGSKACYGQTANCIV